MQYQMTVINTALVKAAIAYGDAAYAGTAAEEQRAKAQYDAITRLNQQALFGTRVFTCPLGGAPHVY